MSSLHPRARCREFRKLELSLIQFQHARMRIVVKYETLANRNIVEEASPLYCILILAEIEALLSD
jgi:hypothetical protein